MDEAHSKQIAGAFHRILLIRRLSWWHTKTTNRDHPKNVLAIRNVFSQQRFRHIRSIVILGLANPGTVTELLQHSRGRLRGVPLQEQRAIFTQIAIGEEISHTLQLNFGRTVTTYAYNPDFSPGMIKGLSDSRINVIQDLGQVVDGRCLIYDVSKQIGHLSLVEGLEGFTPPAAIMTDWMSILQPDSTEARPDLLRDYHMVSLVDFPSRVAPTREEERLVFRDRSETVRRQKERELRDWESQATRREYEKSSVEHNSLLSSHERRVRELAHELRDNGVHEAEKEAVEEARRRLLTEAPVRIKSYVNDPMMILLVRKSA